VRRVDPETAYELLWQDLMALHREAVAIHRRRYPDGDERPAGPARFMHAVSLGRREGRLVAAVDRLMREATYGAVLDDPRRPDALLETRIVLAAKPYSFLWPQDTLDLAHRRARRFGDR